MAFLTAAVVLVAALCLLNLVLTLGVVRRLREHSDLLGRSSPHEAPRPVLAPGETIGAFDATTIDGEPVSAQRLDARTLVGFFSPDCFACKEQLPRFVDAAGEEPGGRQRVLAVVVGTAGTGDLVAALAPVARVVEEAPDGPVARAFAIQGFPAFCRLDGDGVVATSGFDLRELAAPDRA